MSFFGACRKEAVVLTVFSISFLNKLLYHQFAFRKGISDDIFNLVLYLQSER